MCLCLACAVSVREGCALLCSGLFLSKLWRGGPGSGATSSPQLRHGSGWMPLPSLSNIVGWSGDRPLAAEGGASAAASAGLPPASGASSALTRRHPAGPFTLGHISCSERPSDYKLPETFSGNTPYPTPASPFLVTYRNSSWTPPFPCMSGKAHPSSNIQHSVREAQIRHQHPEISFGSVDPLRRQTEPRLIPPTISPPQYQQTP